MWETDHSGRFDPQTIFDWAASVLQPPKHQQHNTQIKTIYSIISLFFLFNEDHVNISVVEILIWSLKILHLLLFGQNTEILLEKMLISESKITHYAGCIRLQPVV